MLSAILHHLDRIYDLELDVDIGDFLIGREACTHLGADARHSKVLVKQDGSGDGIELGVYIDEKRLARLGAIDLSRTISAESFELLVTSIEEVSHFAYLLFSAARKKRVTQLELELQAEVDKFLMSTVLLASRNEGLVPSNLLDRLFGDFQVRRDLDRGMRERYLAASSLASRYCCYVVQTSLLREGLKELLPELRRFYRLGQNGKIGRIHRFVYNA